MKLPEYLAFFGGRRFVPIATGISAVCLGLLFGVIWPPLQQGINGLGQLMLESGSFGAFAFGVLNRLLIVTGCTTSSTTWCRLRQLHRPGNRARRHR